VKKNRSVEEFDRVITYCEMHGTEPEYQFLVDVIEEVANSSAGIDKEEKQVMDDFVEDLTSKFRKDIETINNQN
jgi:hypothetical protein